MGDGTGDPNDGGDSPSESGPSPTDAPPLLSRILVTWVELTVVAALGVALGTSASGPPVLVVYFATTLASVGVLLYNVDRHVRAWLGVPG